MAKDSLKTIAKNKKAWHEYFIEESFEAGISLIRNRSQIYKKWRSKPER